MKKILVPLLLAISIYAVPPSEEIITAQSKEKAEKAIPSKLHIIASLIQKKFTKESPDTLIAQPTQESRVDNFIMHNLLLSTGE